MLFKTALYTWLVSIFVGFVMELDSSREIIFAKHTSLVNFQTDCTRVDFARRYKMECADITLNPPSSLITMWVREAIANTNWCSFMGKSCDEYLSVKGLVILALVYALKSAPGFIKKKTK